MGFGGIVRARLRRGSQEYWVILTSVARKRFRASGRVVQRGTMARCRCLGATEFNKDYIGALEQHKMWTLGAHKVDQDTFRGMLDWWCDTEEGDQNY